MTKKLINLTLIILLLTGITGTSFASTIQSNTPVRLKSEETLITKNLTENETVKFSVNGNVLDSNRNVIISSGTPVTAQVTYLQNKNRIGKSGELTVSNFRTTTTDGQSIELVGSTMARPDNRRVRSIVLSAAICPLFLLMRGAEAEIPSGTSVVVYTK